MKEERTEVSELGEFGLIARLTANWPLFTGHTRVAVGDDAAVVAGDEGSEILVTTDMLVEGVHFDLSYTPLRHLGYKSVVVNLSDICAMNGVPRQVLISIGVSNRFSVEALEELYGGIRLACEKYKVDLIGGDTTTSPSGLIISVTALGGAEKGRAVLRSGAKVNDLLVVSGDLGGAYMGLQVLEREKAVFLESPGVQPDLEGADYILERQLKPEARTDIREILGALEICPGSMIDISDGLSSEAIHLARLSGTGVVIYEERIPIDPVTYEKAREFGLDPTLCALSGGEDYELLFTIPVGDYEKLKGNPHFTAIGHMCDPSEGYQLVDRQGGVHGLTAQGWDPLIRQR